jgi:MoaA/NifB/PqqE/SkfB family radical SAM enzyme
MATEPSSKGKVRFQAVSLGPISQSRMRSPHLSMNSKIERKYENLFRALREQGAGVASVESFPISLCLDPASACSLRCPFCIHGESSLSRTYRVMNWDLFQSIIEESGPYLFQVDLFNWGEPLLNKRLLDMIALLRGYDINIRLSTSLALPLSEEFLEGLILSGINYIVISIDGMSPETYETYRVDGEFGLAMSNMEKLAELKHRLKVDKPRLEWQYLVFSFNEQELPKAIQHARRIGVEFRPAAPYINLDQHPEWLPSEDRFVREPYKAFMALRKNRPREVKVSDSLSSAEAVIMSTGSGDKEAEKIVGRDGALQTEVLTSSNLATPQRYRCDWHYMKACINADGTLSPCCGLYPGEPNWGEVGRGHFHGLWNNSNFQEARKTLAEGCLDNASGIICAQCPLPEIQHDGRSVLLDALMDAPGRYRKLARPVLKGLPRRDRLVRQSLRVAGKMLRYLPYRYRDLLRRRLGYEMQEGVLRRALETFLRSAAL